MGHEQEEVVDEAATVPTMSSIPPVVKRLTSARASGELQYASLVLDGGWGQNSHSERHVLGAI